MICGESVQSLCREFFCLLPLTASLFSSSMALEPGFLSFDCLLCTLLSRLRRVAQVFRALHLWACEQGPLRFAHTGKRLLDASLFRLRRRKRNLILLTLISQPLDLTLRGFESANLTSEVRAG